MSIVHYNSELFNMLEDCEGWDSEEKALTEAFKRGIEFQKQAVKIKIIKDIEDDSFQTSLDQFNEVKEDGNTN